MTDEEKMYIKLLGLTSKRADIPYRTFYHSKLTEDNMTFIVLIEDEFPDGRKRIVYEAKSII